VDRRRFLLTSLAGALALVAPAAGQAQGPTRVPTIGALSPGSPTAPNAVPSRGAFEAGLKELGWTPGHTVRIDYRYADGQRDRLSELARELVRARIDVVASLARPGSNVTGLTTMAPGTSQKLVELLRETVPSVSRIGVLRTGASPFPEIRRELEIAKILGLTIPPLLARADQVIE
jgi:putative tryptophan/tyrosine transport system substrate-binding protein